MSASPLTPLDYIAAGYWQDFLAKRAITGGIAYEAELHNCQLDESLASLQRVDTLLSQIRRDMIKTSMWQEATLLTDERYRNFMVFLAFYAGRVLAQQWQQSPHWFGQFELSKRYPALPPIADDFYQHMAVFYGSDHTTDEDEQSSNNRVVGAPLFFALEPIGMRLFGHIDRQFKSVQGGEVASGLYQAVTARIPSSINNHSLNYKMALLADGVMTEKAAISIVKQEVYLDSDLAKATHSSQTFAITCPLLDEQANDAQTKPTLSKSVPDKIEPSKIESALEPTIPSAMTTPAPALKTAVKAPPTPAIFSQLLTELDEIEVPQAAGKSEYEQARKVLDQFEQHIAKQQKPRESIRFSAAHLQAKQQALLTLQDAASAGNTAAMLRLSMYQLLAEDLNADAEVGVEWVKQAASKNDSRAQRLLSKMYYQGIGLPQDMNNGKHWLEQAAENGHADATNLVKQWQQAQVLITTQKQEQHSLKRYQLLFAVIIVIALFIIVLV